MNQYTIHRSQAIAPPATSNFVLDGGDGSSVVDQINAAFDDAGVAVLDGAGGIVGLFTSATALVNYGASLSPAATIDPATYSITYADGSSGDISIALAETVCLKSKIADASTAIFRTASGQPSSVSGGTTGPWLLNYTDSFEQVWTIRITQTSAASLPGLNVSPSANLTWGAARSLGVHDLTVELLDGPTAGDCAARGIFQIGITDFDRSGSYTRAPNPVQIFPDIFTQSGPVQITQDGDRFDAVLPDGADSGSSVNSIASHYEMGVGDVLNFQFEGSGGGDAITFYVGRRETNQIATGVVVGGVIYSATDHNGDSIADLSTLEVRTGRPTARATFADDLIDVSESTPDEFGLAGFDFVHERAGAVLTQRSTTSVTYPLTTTQAGDTITVSVFDISGSRSRPVTITV